MIYDHTYEPWAKKIISVNGAVTYSVDFVETVLPHLNIPEDVDFSVAPPLDQTNTVQILHSYNNKLFLDIERRKTVGSFITHYKQVEYIINNTMSPHSSYYVPMSINTKKLPNKNKQKNGKWIYFGNVTREKTTLFNELKKHISFDVMSKGRFNDHPVSREQTFEILNEYSYGIGVGRCLMEMMHLGIKPLVLGQRFGGVILNKNDWKVQLASNCNGRVRTGDANINECIKLIDYTYIPPKAELDMSYRIKDYQKAIDWLLGISD